VTLNGTRDASTDVDEVATPDQTAASTDSATGGEVERSHWRNWLIRVFSISEVGVLVPLVFAIVVFTAINSSFLSSGNTEAILTGMSYVGIIAVGQTFLLVSGEFDLSVGSNAGLSAVCAAWIMTHGLPAGVGIVLGIAVGALVGLTNAIVVVKLRIPAFIATIGMLYIAQGVTLLIGHGYTIYPLPGIISDIGTARVLGLSVSFILLIVLTIIGQFILWRTTFGRAAYATGGNREVARIAGINVERLKMINFIVTGALAAVAGILIMSSVASAGSDIGSGYELLVIASVVIGGVSLFGGVGSVIGAFLGVLLLEVVQSGLIVSGLSSNWETVSVGVIMILAVGIDVLRRARVG
jgi:ribose transport system permease protein